MADHSIIVCHVKGIIFFINHSPSLNLIHEPNLPDSINFHTHFNTHIIAID
ncbi:hypothetical protein GW891_01930 [bacterium]|nr:hypothetical protein [bacterium]